MAASDRLPEMLSIRQTAALLGVHPETLRRWDAQGKLRARRIGPRGARRYARADVLRMLQAADDRVRDAQRVVVDVARAISGSLDLETVARTVVEAAVHVVGSQRCAIYLLSDDRTLYEPLFGIDILDPSSTRLFYANPVPVDALPMGRLALEKPDPIVIDDTETHPLSNPAVFRIFNTRTFIAVGMRSSDGEAYGVMTFGWVGTPHPIRDDDVFLAQSLAALAEVALTNARLFTANEQERSRAQAISDLVRDVNSGRDLRDTLERAIGSLVEQLRADEGSLFLVSEDRSEIVGAVETRVHGPSRIGARLSLAGAPNILRAIEHGGPLLVPRSASQGEEQPWFESLDVELSLFVPLLVQGTPVGIAFVNFLDRAPLLRSDDLHFASLLGGQCAIAIDRVRLLEDAFTRAAELEAVFDAMADSVIISDRDGNVVASNAAAMQVLGLDKVGPGLETRLRQLNLRHTDGRPVTPDDSATGRALRGETVTNMELLSTRPVLGERVLLMSSAPILDAEGRVSAAVSVARDITEVVAARREREQLDQRLGQKAAELEAVIGQMGEGIIIADAGGRITLVNGYAARLHGMARLDVTPEDYAETYHLLRLDGTPYPSLELPLSRAALKGETIPYAEWRIRRPDGSEIIAAGSATPILDENGRRLGAVLVVRDVTERRRLDEEKSQFLSIVSHELKTPLTTIKGLNDLARRRVTRGAEPSQVLRNLDGVAGQVARMEGLIGDLLDLQRLETGVLPLQCAPLDLHALVADVCERAQATTERHRIHVCLAAPPPITVDADQRRIEQVLDNLLSNAIKYSPDGGLIELDLSRDEQMVTLLIRDRGIGIPEVGRERLFERYYRGTNVRASEYGGLGIGLALSRDIMQRHGGSLVLDESSPAGSTFRLMLPVWRDDR
jgi:PAS domain S-box-containing protein